MGAGARFASERDRWPEHWRLADLDMEEDGLLELLDPAEELRAVVPVMRSTPGDGEEQVLLGVTDRRVLLIGRRRSRDGTSLGVLDVTEYSSTAPRGQRVVPHVDGHLSFDVDEESMARIWASIDELHRARDRSSPVG